MEEVDGEEEPDKLKKEFFFGVEWLENVYIYKHARENA